VLGLPHLWISNADANLASARVKERQGQGTAGSRLVGFEPAQFVSGEARRRVWQIEREAWLARRS
jgi:hypothetical protein